MQIISIQTQIKKIPLKTPFITALRRVDNVEFVRVIMACGNGLVGVGEAPATKAITGEDLDDILNSIKTIESLLISQTPSKALELLHNTKIGTSAKAAVDMALLTIIAQSKKQALYQYLGATKTIQLQTDITISLKSKDEMLKDSFMACGNGMDILKIKLAKDIAHAIDVTKAISKAIPHAMIIIDANQAWSVKQTIEFIEAMKEVKIELIEQPVIASDLEGLKKITQLSHIPILADESVFNLEDAKSVIESKSADMINIKLMKCGGITKAVEILEYAKSKNVKCMLGSMLEGPYSINSALHLAMAYPDTIKYIDLDSPLLYKEKSDELEFSFQSNTITYS